LKYLANYKIFYLEKSDFNEKINFVLYNPFLSGFSFQVREKNPITDSVVIAFQAKNLKINSNLIV
jgi:hypothetical protein